MRTKNITKIIFAAVFCAALAFTACSPEEPTAEIFAENSKGEWQAAEPVGKIAIAVDEDNYDGLLEKLDKKPTSKINIEIKNGRCFFNIQNKEFADYFYIPQNIELHEGESFFYKKIDLLNPANKLANDTIVATDTIDMNKSFPLVTNIAYHTLQKLDIDKFTPMIDPMIINMGTGFIMKKITQEGGIRIESMDATLYYDPEMTFIQYINQIKVKTPFGPMGIGPVASPILVALSGNEIEGNSFYTSKVLEVIPVLIPAIIKHIKPKTINEILEVALSSLGTFIRSMAEPIITGMVHSYNIPEPMRDIPLSTMQNTLIDGAKYIQANLKSAAKISEFAIVPTKSTVSLRKLKYEDENNTLLINTMNFKFTDIKLSPIENSKLKSEQLGGLNTLVIPTLNFVIPKVLNNPNMIPGGYGQKLEQVNDFNYTITSSITKN